MSAPRKAAEDRPLVSAVIPAFNAERTLEETLRSVRAQSWDNLEIVVVDDESDDATPAIAARHAAEDARIRVIRVPNGGAGAARNHGARASRGSFIAPCDADDLWHPEKIARQMQRMAELGPDCGYIYTRSRSIDGDDRVVAQKRVDSLEEGWVYLRLLVANFVGNGSSLLIRREALESVGGYETRLKNCEDWHLQCVIARRWRVGAVDAYLTGYRRLPDSKSARNKVRHKTMHLQALRYILEREPDTPSDVAAAAEASARASLAMTLLRRGRRREALSEVVAALRASPSASLAALRFRAVIAAGGLARRVTGLKSERRSKFSELGPCEPQGRILPLQNPRLLARLRRREEPFRASSVARAEAAIPVEAAR